MSRIFFRYIIVGLAIYSLFNFSPFVAAEGFGKKSVNSDVQEIKKLRLIAEKEANLSSKAIAKELERLVMLSKRADEEFKKVKDLRVSLEDKLHEDVGVVKKIRNLSEKEAKLAGKAVVKELNMLTGLVKQARDDSKQMFKLKDELTQKSQGELDQIKGELKKYAETSYKSVVELEDAKEKIRQPVEDLIVTTEKANELFGQAKVFKKVVDSGKKMFDDIKDLQGKADDIRKGVQVAKDSSKIIQKELGIFKNKGKKFRKDLKEIKTLKDHVLLLSQRAESELERAVAVRQKTENMYGKDIAGGEKALVYKKPFHSNLGPWYSVPGWPSKILYFRDNDLITCDLSFKRATKSFSSSGKERNLADLAFSDSPIYLRDILLVSKLLKNEKVDLLAAKEAYFTDLADQLIVFDGAIDEFAFIFDYVRHFRKNKVAVGFRLPLIYKRRDLTMETPEFTDKLNNMSAAVAAEFESVYHSDFKEFFSVILDEKNLDYVERESESGVGDLEAFITYAPKIKKLRHSLFGISLLLPTAQKTSGSCLWEPELGTGGIPEVSLFGVLLWERSNLLNPYIKAEITCGLTAHVRRRIPKVKEHEADFTVPSESDLLVFGNKIEYTSGVAFEEYDSIVRWFANESKKIKLEEGLAFAARIGNMLTGLFRDRGSADLFYDVRVKAKDSIGASGLSSELWDKSIWENNTSEAEHIVGVDFSYQFTRDFRFKLGTQYTIAGRNVPKTFGVHLGLNAEF